MPNADNKRNKIPVVTHHDMIINNQHRDTSVIITIIIVIPWNVSYPDLLKTSIIGLIYGNISANNRRNPQDIWVKHWFLLNIFPSIQPTQWLLLKTHICSSINHDIPLLLGIFSIPELYPPKVPFKPNSTPVSTLILGYLPQSSPIFKNLQPPNSLWKPCVFPVLSWFFPWFSGNFSPRSPSWPPCCGASKRSTRRGPSSCWGSSRPWRLRRRCNWRSVLGTKTGETWRNIAQIQEKTRN